MHRNHNHDTRASSSRHEGARNPEEFELMRLRAEAFKQLLLDPSPARPVSRRNVRAQIAALENQLLRMEELRAQPHTRELLVRMARLAAQRALMRWWLFPINDMLPEILQRIFTIFTFSEPMSRIPKARATLTSVCAYWRTTVMSMSTLWSMIPVRELPPFPRLDMNLRLVQRQLLTIRIDQRKHDWSGAEFEHRIQPSDMRRLMTIIAGYLPQVRELEILADTCAVIAAAETVLQDVPPPRSLERLEICRTGNAYTYILDENNVTHDPPRDIVFPLRLFRGVQAPMLKHATFVGVWVDFRSYSFRDLRTLDMQNMTKEQLPAMRDFFPVLQGSPRLEKLIFNAAAPRMPVGEDRTWADAKVNLGYLRELELGNMREYIATYLVQLICAPRLKRLTLSRLHNGDFTDFITLISDGRYRTVTELTVHGLSCEDERVVSRWIRTMPVRCLRVGDVSSTFYLALAHRFPDTELGPPHTRSVCPRLTACEILGWRGGMFEAFQTFYMQKCDTLRFLIIGDGAWDLIRREERPWFMRLQILKRTPERSYKDFDRNYVW